MNSGVLIFGGRGFQEWGRNGVWPWNAGSKDLPGAQMLQAGLPATGTWETFHAYGWGRRNAAEYLILRRWVPDGGRSGYAQTLLLSPPPEVLETFNYNPARLLEALLRLPAEHWSPKGLDELVRQGPDSLFATLTSRQTPTEEGLPLAVTLGRLLLLEPESRMAFPLGGEGVIPGELTAALDLIPRTQRTRITWLAGPALDEDLSREYGVSLFFPPRGVRDASLALPAPGQILQIGRAHV